jgi:hypothetical protein
MCTASDGGAAVSEESEGFDARQNQPEKLQPF